MTFYEDPEIGQFETEGHCRNGLPGAAQRRGF